jgi:hypothetical protein
MTRHRSLAQALAAPEEVTALSLRGKKALTELSGDVGRHESPRAATVPVDPRRAGRHSRPNAARPSGNQLRDLPPDVWDLQNLKDLNLSQNLLAVLSDGIGRLASLERLELTFNRSNPYVPASVDMDLSALFANAGRLGRLRELDLQWMNLTTLPNDVGEFPRLRVVKLGSEFPAAERERIRAALPRVKVLYAPGRSMA